MGVVDTFGQGLSYFSVAIFSIMVNILKSLVAIIQCALPTLKLLSEWFYSTITKVIQFLHLTSPSIFAANYTLLLPAPSLIKDLGGLAQI